MKREAQDSRPASAAFLCDGCHREIVQTLPAPVSRVACPGCGREHDLAAGGATLETRLLSRCARCGLDRLYVQKDFNKKLRL